MLQFEGHADETWIDESSQVDEVITRADLPPACAVSRSDVLEAICLLEPRVRALVAQAKEESTVGSFCGEELYYAYYKPRIELLVGWEAEVKEVATSRCHDAVTYAIYHGLPHCTADCGCWPDELDGEGNRVVWPAPAAPEAKPDLRAIETRYRGHLYRSRTEARWAVFMDTYGIRYEYEAEGFQVGRLRYLPDFYLPDIDAWLEVKPLVAFGSPAAMTKPKALAEAGGKPVLMVYGSPWVGEHRVRHISGGANVRVLPTFAADWYELAECASCYGLHLMRNDNDETARLTCKCASETCIREGALLVNAFRAARSARFEHGRAS